MTAEPAHRRARVLQSLEARLFSAVSSNAVSWDDAGEAIVPAREWRADSLRVVRERRPVLRVRWSRVMRARIMLSTVNRMASLRSA